MGFLKTIQESCNVTKKDEQKEKTSDEVIQKPLIEEVHEASRKNESGYSSNNDAPEHDVIEQHNDVIHPSIDDVIQRSDDVTDDNLDQVYMNSHNSVDEAISSLFDTDPVTRAASCRYLTTCIKHRTDDVIDKVDKLFDVMMELLEREQDTFVYLSVVRALSEITNVKPQVNKRNGFFERIFDAFKAQVFLTKQNEAILLKLGEVVMRCVKDLGDMSHHYMPTTIPVLLTGCQSSSTSVQVTCLSILADVLPLVATKLNCYQYELSDCICASITKGGTNEVKRAGVHIIRMLVENLNSQLITVFPVVLKRWYQVLKSSYMNDDDNTVQLHSQLTLEALDSVMRAMLFSNKNNMQKKITVLPT